MKLIIVRGFQRTEINDVLVDDEGNPSVCDQTISISITDGDSGEQLTLQPKIWFKVMVLDSIVVDCERRVLQWKCKSEGKEDGSKMKELDYQAVVTNMDDYDNQQRLWDQLYELGLEILDNELQKDDSEAGETCELKGIRLLYCFALPLISFDQSFMPAFHHAKNYVVSLLGVLDSKLDERIRALDSRSISLKDQRLHFWPNLLVNQNVENFDLRLLEDMLNHVDSDIQDISDQLDSASKEYEQVKAAPNHDPSIEQKIRDRRSALRRQLDQVKLASDEVRSRHNDANQQRRYSTDNDWDRRKSRKSLLQTYLKGYEGVKRVRKQVEKLMTTKLRLTAAREAIDSCSRLLEAGQSTCGPGTSLDGEPTEVDLPIGTLPRDWCNLADQVRLITCDSRSRVYEVMRAGQKEVERILEDATVSIHQSIEKGNIRHAAFDVEQSCDPVTLSVEVRSKINEFKQYVHGHMTIVFEELRTAFKEPRLSSKLLYVCYQRHFYLPIMRRISLFYDLVYADIIQRLYAEFLTKMTYKDLCSNGYSDKLFEIAKVKNAEDTINTSPCRSFSLLIPRLVGQSVFYITYMEQVPNDDKNSASDTNGENGQRTSQSSEEQEKEQKTDRPSEENFAKEISLLSYFPEKMTPFDQVEYLDSFLQKIIRRVNDLDESDNVGTDYLSVLLPLLLCKCDAAFAATFYARLQFLNDSNPEYMRIGIHAFALTALLGAFVYIFNAGITRSRLSLNMS